MLLMDYLGKPVTFEARGSHLMMHISDLGTVDALALADTEVCPPEMRAKIHRAAEVYFAPAVGSKWLWNKRRAVLDDVSNAHVRLSVCTDEDLDEWAEREITRDEWVRAINRRKIVRVID